MKKTQHASKRSLFVEKQKDFSYQKCIDSQPEKKFEWGRLHRASELYGRQTESKFLRFALGRLISIRGHLIGVKRASPQVKISSIYSTQPHSITAKYFFQSFENVYIQLGHSVLSILRLILLCIVFIIFNLFTSNLLERPLK